MQKVALVTGGNSGIGYAVAKLLKQKEYDVTICGRDSERVKTAAEELSVSFLIADLADSFQVDDVVEHFSGKPLNVLVNNAAIAKFMPLSLCTDDNFDEIFNINVRAPINLIKGLTPSLKMTQGSVTNVSSAIVNNGLPNASLYAATKGALEAATKSIALELAPLGIRVNALAPGAIDTPIINKLGIDQDTLAVMKAQQEAMIPMRRYGQPEEIAEVIVAQLESTYTTGAVWEVDGGVNAI